MTDTLEAAWTARRSGGTIQRPDDTRGGFERDRARVVHSEAFRRLQAKTQIFGLSHGDFPRTRLTHSLEVAQVGRALANRLKQRHPDETALPSTELMEAMCLAHDLGHSPFGHGGEGGLNATMLNYGGFEGNGHTLRLMARLESHTRGFGMDPCRRTLLGLLKYPVPYSKAVNSRASHWNPARPPKCYLDTESEVVEWILSPFDRDEWNEAVKLATPQPSSALCHNPSIDTSILTLADDTGYACHDLEDSATLGHLREQDFMDLIVKGTSIDNWLRHCGINGVGAVANGLFRGDETDRKQVAGGLINAMVMSAKLVQTRGLHHPLLRARVRLVDEADQFLTSLKKLVFEHVILSPMVMREVHAGQLVVRGLFEALIEEPLLLPVAARPAAKLARSEGNAALLARLICDYVASLSDESAGRLHRQVFGVLAA